MSLVGHRGHTSLGSPALTQEHGKAQPAQRSHAWAPAGIKDGMGTTWGQQGHHPGCHQCRWGVPAVPSLTMGAHNKGVWRCAVWWTQQQGLKGLGTCAGEGIPLSTHHLGHPATLTTPRTRGPPAPRWHPGAAGAPGRSPCVVGLCPLQGGRTVRVFQVTPGTTGASSTGTQWRGSSWPAGGSTATTWGRAADGIRAPLPQGSWPLPGCNWPQCARGPGALVLCGAVLCHVVLYSAIPCHAVPGHTALCWVILLCAMPCHAAQYLTMPRSAVPCPTVPCNAMLDLAAPRHAELCCATLHFAMCIGFAWRGFGSRAGGLQGWLL